LDSVSAVLVHSSPNSSFLSEALDAADAVRFSMFKCFKVLTGSSRAAVVRSLSVSESSKSAA
jgi:hypothetical protein